MSREPRRMEKNTRESGKILVYMSVAVALVLVIIAYTIMFKDIEAKNKTERLAENESQEKIAEQQSLEIELVNIDDENTESVSTQIGKSVEEKKTENSEIKNTQNKNTEKVETQKKDNTIEKTNTNNTTKNENTENKKQEESKKEITFVMPIEGEIIKGFAKETLVYSETLQEWIVHQAIDVKANSRDVVKASAEGTVMAIKSDPRYGLTVIVEHEAGFKTVYSNLLTAEFVVEGEKVKQGQTIGTIGSSATFEIADEPHLHFEMLKDSIYVDPSIYIK